MISIRFNRPASAGRYLMIQAGASALVTVICGASAMDLIPSVNVSCYLFTTCMLWLLYSWGRIAQSIVSPYWLFVFVAALFNGGHSILQAFGLNENGVMDSRFSDATTATTVLYVTLSMMLLHFGALFRVASKPARNPETPAPGVNARTIQLGFALVLIALVPAYLQFRDELGTVLSGGYGSLYRRELQTSFDAWHAILAQFMLPGAFLLAAAARQRRGIRRISLLIVTVYVVMNMFMGYRGAAGAAIISFGWLWHARVRKLPLSASIAASVLLIFVVFPMIRVHRSTFGDDRLSVQGFTGTLKTYDNPAVASVREMGGTMSTIAYTMDLAPSVREFDYGQSYAFAALTLLPNIFGTPLHPSIAHGTSSDWLNQTVNYQMAMNGGGLGYSFIAEAYLNFGWMGPLVMIVLGFGFATMECAAARNASPAIAALMGTILYFAAIYARAETSDIVRGITWCGFAPLLIVSMFNRFEKRQQRRSALSSQTASSPSSKKQCESAG